MWVIIKYINFFSCIKISCIKINWIKDYYDRLNTQKKSLWNNTERSQQEKECYDRFDAEFRRSASLNNERNIFNNPIRRFDDRQFRLNDIEIDEDFYFIENNNKKLEINTEEDDRDKRDFCTDFKQDLYNNFEYDKDEHLSSSYSKFSDNDENTNKKDSENKSVSVKFYFKI